MRFLLLSLMICGCHIVYPGDGSPITVVFDPNVPEALRTEFMAGTTYWACVGVDISTQYGGDELPVKVGTLLELGVDGKYWADGSITLDSQKLAGKSVRTRMVVSAHEVGHAIGMHHGSDPLSVMHHLVREPKHLMSQDVDQFNTFWNKHYPLTCPDVLEP